MGSGLGRDDTGRAANARQRAWPRGCEGVLGHGAIDRMGGGVAAYVKRLQSRMGEQEKALIEYKLYVAGR